MALLRVEPAEASYFDQFNMTENGLEHDQKITPTNSL